MNWLGHPSLNRPLVDLLSGDDAEERRPRDLTLLRFGRQAMATLFEVLIPFGHPRATESAESALNLIDDIEDQLSAFRPHSEIVQMNERAYGQDVPVESILFDLLAQAAGITRETQGAFDIATGALSRAWGFYRRSGRVPTVAERAEAISRTGMRHVILNAETSSVRYLRKGLEINLGGIGKGHALDRAGEHLRSQGITAGLVHGGMSSVLAIGAPVNHPAGWVVSLRHPWEVGRAIGVVHLRDQSLGTSAATYQFFEYNGRKLGHILDPRKGWPAEGLEQVTVIAPSAAEADALSTALYVMGLEAAKEYCRTHPRVAAIILATDSDGPVTFNIAPGAFIPNLPT